jgi:Ca2+/Na+ antiporter
MNILLIFFAIPLATIILSIIFETLIQCPFKIAGIAFSIFLIIAFALGGSSELIVAAIVYTLLSFLSAYITMFIQNRTSEEEDDDEENNNNNNNNNGNSNGNGSTCRRCNRI